MSKKGFTLIEVMTMVLIIAAIALISFPVLINVLQKNKDIEEDTFKENAILAAKTYFNLNRDKFVLDEDGYAEVSIQTLIDEGYLDDAKTDGNYQNDVVNCNQSNECNFMELKVYNVGDTYTLSGDEYYVISSNKKYVTLLKAKPLTKDEVSTYGVGHINKYTPQYLAGEVGSYMGKYGTMAYYSSETCGWINGSWMGTGCINDYNQSEVKYAVDTWASAKFTNGELATDSDGYKARLLNTNDLRTNLGYKWQAACVICGWNSWVQTKTTPRWVYDANVTSWHFEIRYWMLDKYEGSSDKVWHIFYYLDENKRGMVDGLDVYSQGCIRPVINVYKSAIEQ